MRFLSKKIIELVFSEFAPLSVLDIHAPGEASRGFVRPSNVALRELPPSTRPVSPSPHSWGRI